VETQVDLVAMLGLLVSTLNMIVSKWPEIEKLLALWAIIF
jgi:hypothetical protein